MIYLLLVLAFIILVIVLVVFIGRMMSVSPKEKEFYKNMKTKTYVETQETKHKHPQNTSLAESNG